jgi:hypothetical protein
VRLPREEWAQGNERRQSEQLTKIQLLESDKSSSSLGREKECLPHEQCKDWERLNEGDSKKVDCTQDRLAIEGSWRASSLQRA